VTVITAAHPAQKTFLSNLVIAELVAALAVAVAVAVAANAGIGIPNEHAMNDAIKIGIAIF
jgi:hypothetical protein